MFNSGHIPALFRVLLAIALKLIPLMRSVRGIMMEQARQIRERAVFYRRLAKTLGGNRSAFEVTECADKLEQRAREIEEFALLPRAPSRDAALDAMKPDCEDFEEAGREPIANLWLALELVFQPDPKLS